MRRIIEFSSIAFAFLTMSPALAGEGPILTSILSTEKPHLNTLKINQERLTQEIRAFEQFKSVVLKKIPPGKPLKDMVDTYWSEFQKAFPMSESLMLASDASADFRVGIDTISEALITHEVDCDTGTFLFLDLLAERYGFEELGKQAALVYFNSHLSILFGTGFREGKDDARVFDVGDGGLSTDFKTAKKTLGPWYQIVPMTKETIAASAKLMLGIALTNMGEPQGGLQALRDALKIIPMPVLHINIGNELLAMGNPKESIESFKLAQKLLNSSDQSLDYGLAIAYLELGNSHESDKYFTKAFKSRWSEDPQKWKVDNAKRADAYAWNGITQMDSLRPDYALRFFEKAKKLDPKAIEDRLFNSTQSKLANQTPPNDTNTPQSLTYQSADRLLNSVYGKLRSVLNASQKESLKKQQLEWIKKRESVSPMERPAFVMKRVESLEQQLREESKKFVKRSGQPFGDWTGKFAPIGAIDRASIVLSPSRKGWVNISGATVSEGGNLAEIDNDESSEAILVDENAIWIKGDCRVVIRPEKRALLVYDESSGNCWGEGATFTGVYIRVP